MKKKTIQAVDPAEICECNPEWSGTSSDNDWDDCRCSVIDPAQENTSQDKQQA